MRLARLPLAAATLLACVALAGCASSTQAGWTFAPPPAATPTPAASAGGTGSPVASGSPAASAAAADVTISALNVAFEQSSVDAPAGKAFTLLFDNKDASIMHNVVITDSSGVQVFAGAIVTGVVQTTYNVPALAAGTYKFTCVVHSNMTGSLVAK